MKISKNWILGAIFVSLTVAISSVIVYKPNEFETSKVSVFLKIIQSTAFILVAIGLILTAQALEESQRVNSVDATLKMIDRGLINVVTNMRENHDKCPGFVGSLWPQKGLFPNQTPQLFDGNEIQPDKNEDFSAIIDVCFKIFQSWEDHFTAGGFDATGEVVWAGNYLQWVSSGQLYYMWKRLAPNFKNTTIEYGDLLFVFVKENPIRTEKELLDASYKFASLPELKSIAERASL